MLGIAWPLVITFLLAVSVPQVIPFILYGIDKFLAKVNGPRIPELVLLASSFLFGGLGSQVAMSLFRHKTGKTSFKVKFYIVWFLRVLILVGLAVIIVFYF